MLTLLSEPLPPKYNASRHHLDEFKVASAFHKKALQCYYKQEFFLATFMMQQSILFVYKQLVSRYLNIMPKSAGINELRLLLQKHLPEFKDFFSCNTVDECRFMQHLESAELHPIYMNEFNLYEDEIVQLLDRVAELINEAQDFVLTH